MAMHVRILRCIGHRTTFGISFSAMAGRSGHRSLEMRATSLYLETLTVTVGPTLGSTVHRPDFGGTRAVSTVSSTRPTLVLAATQHGIYWQTLTEMERPTLCNTSPQLPRGKRSAAGIRLPANGLVLASRATFRLSVILTATALMTRRYSGHRWATGGTLQAVQRERFVRSIGE